MSKGVREIRCGLLHTRVLACQAYHLTRAPIPSAHVPQEWTSVTSIQQTQSPFRILILSYFASAKRSCSQMITMRYLASTTWHTWSYRREVRCNPAGDEICHPGLNGPIVSLPYLLIYCLDCFFSCILMRVRAQFYFVHVFSSLNNVLIFLCFIFLTHLYVLSVTVLTLWVAPPEMFCNWYRI